MYNICIRIIPNKQDAEDILQDAFIAAFRNLEGFKGESSFGAWLKRIVINHSLNFIKKQKPGFVQVDESFEIPDNNEIEEATNPADVHHAIKELPEGARVILSLHLLEDYKHREIAEMLNISESTSKSQYLRAKSLLREKLKNTVYEKEV